MNATSLYVSTCRLVLQANTDDAGCCNDLYRLLPYLRQSMSCTVCGNLLIEPYTPTETNCQHHVCRTCKGGKKKLKPSCSWCKNYDKYVENVQLRILLQCYKKLCEYLMNSYTYRLLCNSNSILTLGDANITNMIELIKEGAGFKDDYNSNSGLLKSAYSILPCIYATASTQTAEGAMSAEEEDVPIASTLTNGTASLYSVTYAGSGNKVVIKRKAMVEKGDTNCSEESLIKSGFKRPFHKRGNLKVRARLAKEDEKLNQKKMRFGCRCGNATASPGKLTCCGQRCPCYVGSKACLDCKCRGCRNPHTREGQKVIRELVDANLMKHQASDDSYMGDTEEYGKLQHKHLLHGIPTSDQHSLHI